MSHISSFETSSVSEFESIRKFLVEIGFNYSSTEFKDSYFQLTFVDIDDSERFAIVRFYIQEV